MKQISLEHLHLRLPGDHNFIEFVNSETVSNIVALCKSLFPGSRAAVLYGLKKSNSNSKDINPGGVGYSSGAIYYNGEIYFVDEFTYNNTTSLCFCIREVVKNATYLSGDELPAYIERKIYPIQLGDPEPVVEALKYANLIHLPQLSQHISLDANDFVGTVQLSTCVMQLLININIQLGGADEKGVRILLPDVCKIPNQFLGYASFLCEGIFVNGYTSMGIVEEKKYKIFAFNNYLCFAKTDVTSFTNFNQCVTIGAVREYFATVTGGKFPFNVLLYHQIITQL